MINLMITMNLATEDYCRIFQDASCGQNDLDATLPRKLLLVLFCDESEKRP